MFELGNSDGKIPILIWILIGFIALLILLLIILIIIVANNSRNKERFDGVTPIANSVSDNNGTNEFSDSNWLM